MDRRETASRSDSTEPNEGSQSHESAAPSRASDTHHANLGEPTQAAASITNPATDRVNQENRPGFMPDGKLTYGNPQVYGDDQIGRFGTSSGSAGELPGGRIIDLAHGGQAADAWRTDPDFPDKAETSLDAAETLNAGEPLSNTRQSPSANPLTPSS